MAALTLKYTTKTKTGSYEYRRQVPANLRPFIGKYEFKKVLGFTEAEAIKAWPRYDASVAKALAKAKKASGAVTPTEDDIRTALDDHKEALARLADLGITLPLYSEPGEFTQADALLEVFEVKDPIDTLVAGILTSSGPIKAPDATLDDAARVYISERGYNDPAEKKRLLHVKLVVGEIKTALGRNPKLVELKREDARAVRDFMLDERERKPESVERYLNTVRAIVNLGLKEFDLTTGNPFMDLDVKKDPTSTAKSKRQPLPPEVLLKATQRIETKAKDELRLIWLMLAGTGCRPAEVTGLRVKDVIVTGDRPHIKIEWHDERRVKDEVTQRWVPLTGMALRAAKEALEKTTGDGRLFAQYGKREGASLASANLNKHLRVVTADPKHVLYSLRHNMKDRLRVAKVDVTTQSMILGHTVGGVGEGYGSNEAILEVTYAAMLKVA